MEELIFLHLRKIPVKATKKGRIHAVLMYWEAYADREHTIVMSTDPRFSFFF